MKLSLGNKTERLLSKYIWQEEETKDGKNDTWNQEEITVGIPRLLCCSDQKLNKTVC